MAMALRVLVTGGRYYNHVEVVDRELDTFHADSGIAVLIHGGASGADRIADAWARRNGVEIIECKADWETHGRAAGPIRNRHMLTHKPDVCFAFPGGTGTANMKKLAREAGVNLLEIRDSKSSSDSD